MSSTASSTCVQNSSAGTAARTASRHHPRSSQGVGSSTNTQATGNMYFTLSGRTTNRAQNTSAVIAAGWSRKRRPMPASSTAARAEANRRLSRNVHTVGSPPERRYSPAPIHHDPAFHPCWKSTRGTAPSEVIFDR